MEDSEHLREGIHLALLCPSGVDILLRTGPHYHLLQEEVKRLGDEKDTAVATIAEYVASVGELAKARAGAVGDTARVVATKNLSATIINVRRGAEAPLAEINAGSRDGVKAGWVLTIGDGSNFIGNLRITEVDVNRAVGVIELEDAGTRGEVKVGQRAIARAGE